MASWTLIRGLMAAAAALSAIGVIGTGIDPRSGILIQQFERGDKTHYLIGNVSAKNVKIRVVAFDETWRIGKPIGKVLAGPWDVAANSAVEADVTKLRGGELVRFFLEDDSPLGVLHAPRSFIKPEPLPGSKLPATKFAPSAGLNGLGGNGGLYVPDDSVKPGETFMVRLLLSTKSGSKVRFSPPRAVADGLMSHELQPEKIESKTLTILRREGDVVEVDVGLPLKPADEHQVELTFRVPAKNPPPMVTFSAWFANNMGGGVTVARGLKVARQE